MSVAASDPSFKEYLIDHDAQYRELSAEHHKYEERLVELSTIHFPSQEEQLEEATLKKKKLFLKDQMEEIATRYKAPETGH